MPVLEDKQTFFDQFWKTQSETVVDARSLQRAEIIETSLRNREGTLLDIGCGRGLILEYFNYRGYETVGADISPEMVQMLSERGFECRLLDIEKDKIGEKFDVVLCLETLQHLFDPKTALRKAAAAVKPSGELVVSLPNEFHIVARIKFLLGLSHLGHFNHWHIRLFTPKRAHQLFEQLNLKVTKETAIAIVPPRWKFLAKLFRPMAQVMPSLFSLSNVYFLEPK